MILYSFTQKNPASHYVYIDLFVEELKQDFLELQLPAWRPGRYELGNFAKNIKKPEAFNEKGEALPFSKLSKDRWQIKTQNCRNLKVSYSYYAAELNAGACFADTKQLYINPVHCCMQVQGRQNEEHRVDLVVPESYSIVSSLRMDGRTLIAQNFEELVDSPFVASEAIQSEVYEVEQVKYHLHFIGTCKPDFKRMLPQFKAFTQKMIAFWSSFPYDQYHFIVQVLPIKFYHGVEHKKNTVIAIGPAYELNRGATYEDLLGVSCHELFHVWNIKTIRPAEMQPYDFTRENYARTGYVYEGFTTYYGDKLLLSSGVFSLEQYLITLEERLQKHFHNYGRFNLSVAESSWDTWLDGYVPGAPYRKTSIYDEGNLIAFMLDCMILQSSANTRSLRDVCLKLYNNFGKTGKAYTEQDIISLVNEAAGKDLSAFFTAYVYAANDYEKALQPCFDFLGLQFSKEPSPHLCEQRYGFKVLESPGTPCRLSLVAPYSPAWKAGLFAGDDILAVNGMLVKNNLNAWLGFFEDQEELDLLVNSAEEVKNLRLGKDKKGNTYFFQPKLRLQENLSGAQKAAFEVWKSW